MSKLDSIRYITLPESVVSKLKGLDFDSRVPVPVQIPDGDKELDPAKVSIETIVAGMLTVIAYRPEDKHFAKYRDFVLAAQPNAIEELNAAAIAKMKQKDHEFAEQLFLTLWHMAPQVATCVNLATLYSDWAVFERDQKDEKAEDFYLTKCLNTLSEGLERFGENEDLLAELGAFHTYLGNLEIAQDYLERYMKVAPEGEKKQKMKRMLKDVTFRVDSDNEIKQAYDFIMLEEEDKALEVIEKFLEKNPKIWHGWFLKGWALRKQRKFKEAEECFLKCVSLGESNSDIFNELSICSLEKGERELAKSYLDTAIDLDPDNLTLASNLAFLHLMDDEFDEAKEWIEKCRTIEPEDEQVKAMMREYTEKTGEEFGDIVSQEYVHDPEGKEDDGDDDGYAEELAAMAEDDHECGCGHDHHGHDCDCGHDHHDHDCHCGHHHE